MEVLIYSSTIKAKAESLRLAGFTYDEISVELGIAKGTLSAWLKHAPFPERSSAQSKREYFLKHVQTKGAAANKAKKEQMWELLRKESQQSVLVLDVNDAQLMMSLLSVLYWAEGTKYDRGGIVFTNTDPKLAYLFLELLRRTCGIDESRLRVRLHLHYYHKKREAIDFWSNLLRIPKEQFQAAHVKKRSRRKRYRKNFMGICFIKYGDSRTRRKVLSYAYALGERFAPVAQLD